MSKILSAMCNASGVVSAEGVQSGCPLFYLLASNQTLAFIYSKDGAWYLTSSATDIASTMKDSRCHHKIAQSIGRYRGWNDRAVTTAPPPTICSGYRVAINAVVTQMNALRRL